MVYMAGVGMWILATGNVEPANPAQEAAFFAGLVALLAAAAYVFVAFARLKWFYRCPQCGAACRWCPRAIESARKSATRAMPARSSG